jgi:hypothetical protein
MSKINPSFQTNDQLAESIDLKKAERLWNKVKEKTNKIFQLKELRRTAQSDLANGIIQPEVDDSIDDLDTFYHKAIQKAKAEYFTCTAEAEKMSNCPLDIKYYIDMSTAKDKRAFDAAAALSVKTALVKAKGKSSNSINSARLRSLTTPYAKPVTGKNEKPVKLTRSTSLSTSYVPDRFNIPAFVAPLDQINTRSEQQDEPMDDGSELSYETVENLDYIPPPSDFRKGIEAIALLKAQTYSSIMNKETALNSTHYGIKQAEKEFPNLPKEARIDSIAKIETLRSEFVDSKKRTDQEIIIGLKKTYHDAAKTKQILLGFPENVTVLCPKTHFLDEAMIQRVKQAIALRTWQLISEFNKKRTSDTLKKQKKQELFESLKSKRLLENTPEKQLERLSKQVISLSKQVKQKKPEKKQGTNLKPSKQPPRLPKKKQLLQKTSKTKGGNVPEAKPVVKNTGNKEKPALKITKKRQSSKN